MPRGAPVIEVLWCVLLLAALAPVVLWLGARWAAFIERLASPARDEVIGSEANERATGGTISVRIANVAVVHDELLLELIPVAAEGRPAHWLNGPADSGAVRAAERSVRQGSVLRLRDCGWRRVELDIDGRNLDLTRLRDLIEPSL